MKISTILPAPPTILRKIVTHAGLLLVTVFITLLSGCSLLSLQQQVETIYGSKVLVGTVVDLQPARKSQVIVAAYSKIGSKRNIEHYTLLHETGPYELMVPTGEYFIFAFKDLNNDYIYQANEPSGQYSSEVVVITTPGGVLLNLDIVIPEQKNRSSIDFPHDTSVLGNSPPKSHSSAPGAIMEVTDPLFSEENAVKGYWNPLDFFHEIGGNIYFREPYDPSKIPVLFVHGAVGTPKNWHYLLSTLDHELYQPWYFYYPTGPSIKSMADLLFWKISNLHLKYRFPKMYIVAHSMGGLVVRSLLVDYGQHLPPIKKFISISTPWSGDPLSEVGVKYSPGVIPAWKDMGRESEFVQSIYRKPLPKGLDFFLFFGHDGNRNPFRDNNDRVVTLSSQLDPRVQNEASMVYGFNEDHTSILVSDKVASLLNTILVSTEEDAITGSTDSSRQGGYIKVSSSVAPGEKGTVRWPQLYLEQVKNSEKGGIFIQLGPTDKSANVGPFPPGDYLATYLAEGFITEPLQVKISIGKTRSPAVHFNLHPMGSIFDYVQHEFYQDGDPAGTYMLPAEDIKINSIRLTGNDIDRFLVPSMDPKNDMEHYLKQQDWVKKSLFAFYNLPQGEYILTVNAEGYKPRTVRKSIVPGTPNFFKGIVLQPIDRKN